MENNVCVGVPGHECTKVIRKFSSLILGKESGLDPDPLRLQPKVEEASTPFPCLSLSP